MKRDCMILLISTCLIAMSAPQGFGKGPQGVERPQQGNGSTQTQRAMPDKKEQPQSDKPASPPATPSELRRAEQIKRKLRSLGIASRVTIKLNNGNERYGSIERIDEESFELAEVDLKQVFTVRYGDVKKVREGYGNPNQFTGKRWNPIWAKISLVAVIVMFAVVIPLSAPRT